MLSISLDNGGHIGISAKCNAVYSMSGYHLKNGVVLVRT